MYNVDVACKLLFQPSTCTLYMLQVKIFNHSQVPLSPKPNYSAGLHQVMVSTCQIMRHKKGVVSKETVVLHWSGSCTQKFGFINRVDNVN